MWLEQIASQASNQDAYPFPLIEDELDFRLLLEAMIRDRLTGRRVEEIARAFQRGIAQGLGDALKQLGQVMKIDTVVFSGGVFQNELLLEDLKKLFVGKPLTIWTNHAVPANDGGISLGQAALAAFGRFDVPAGMNHDQKK
jgi:hydrogenase maturation protein HypF